MIHQLSMQELQEFFDVSGLREITIKKDGHTKKTYAVCNNLKLVGVGDDINTSILSLINDCASKGIIKVTLEDWASSKSKKS